MERKSMVRNAKTTTLITSTLMLLSGILIMAIPRLGFDGLRYFLGGIYFVMGGARMFGYYSNDLYRLAFQNGFAAGGFCVIISALIFFAPEKVLEELPFIIGFYAILDSMMKLQVAIEAKSFGIKGWVWLVVSASILTIIGILMTIFALTLETNKEIILFSGITIAVDGLENFWETFFTVRVRSRKNQELTF